MSTAGTSQEHPPKWATSFSTGLNLLLNYAVARLDQAFSLDLVSANRVFGFAKTLGFLLELSLEFLTKRFTFITTSL